MDTSANPAKLFTHTVFQAVESVARKTDEQLIVETDELEKIMFGEVFDPISIETAMKLRQTGFYPSELLWQWRKAKMELKGSKDDIHLDPIEVFWDFNHYDYYGLSKYFDENRDSPLISRWLNVPTMQKLMVETIAGDAAESFKVGYFIGKPDVLLKYWKLLPISRRYEANLIELERKLKESFDKVVKSHTFDDRLFDDPFMKTIIKACNEDRDFKDYLESLLNSWANDTHFGLGVY